MMSTKTKSSKSCKSSTTAKAARKPSKPKTKTKPKTTNRTCGCTATKPVLPPIDYRVYNDIDYIDELEKLDAPTYFYYVVNNESKEKYVVSGIELQFNDAKTIAQAATGGDNVYVIKIAGPIAWIFINVFKVVEIELGS